MKAKCGGTQDLAAAGFARSPAFKPIIVMTVSSGVSAKMRQAIGTAV
jgi:hypothetical protein